MEDLQDVSLNIILYLTIYILIDGQLASDELFYLDLNKGDDDASWTALSTTGTGPGQRYGHTLCCIYPHIIVFGGNTGSAPSNEVFIINIKNESNNIFVWQKLDIPSNNSPIARVYHAASVCTKGHASGMMIIFGGRNQQDLALNDTWGLRRHRNGVWDWTKAPVQTNIVPKERYNVRIDIYNKIYCNIFIFYTYIYLNSTLQCF